MQYDYSTLASRIERYQIIEIMCDCVPFTFLYCRESSLNCKSVFRTVLNSLISTSLAILSLGLLTINRHHVWHLFSVGIFIVLCQILRYLINMQGQIYFLKILNSLSGNRCSKSITFCTSAPYTIELAIPLRNLGKN